MIRPVTWAVVKGLGGRVAPGTAQARWCAVPFGARLDRGLLRRPAYTEGQISRHLTLARVRDPSTG
jgi:hypothetical protein